VHDDGGLGVFKQLVKQQPDVATKLALVRFVANVSTSPPVLAALVADPDVLGGLLASTGRATMLASTDRVLATPPFVFCLCFCRLSFASCLSVLFVFCLCVLLLCARVLPSPCTPSATCPPWS
jgi:hypothetical protein